MPPSSTTSGTSKTMIIESSAPNGIEQHLGTQSLTSTDSSGTLSTDQTDDIGENGMEEEKGTLQEKRERRKARLHARILAGGVTGMIVGGIFGGPIGSAIAGPSMVVVVAGITKAGEFRKDCREMYRHRYRGGKS